MCQVASRGYAELLGWIELEVMNIYDFTDSPEYLPGSFEDMGDYEHSNFPIRFFHLGPCIVAQQTDRGEVRIFAPSKGAGYVVNKKLARKHKKSKLPPLRVFNKLPVTILHKVTKYELKDYFLW